MTNYPAVEHFQQHINKMYMFTHYNIFHYCYFIYRHPHIDLFSPQIFSKNKSFHVTLQF